MSERVCGLLIEPRGLTNITILIDNYIRVSKKQGNESMGKLYFYCGASRFKFYSNLYKKNYQIEVISLGLDNLQVHQHNDLLKSAGLWKKLHDDGYTYVLTIQTDGCLCESSEFKISDFINRGYDYIGGYTPYKWWWKETEGLHDYNDYKSFNGGFSLRRITALLDVINKFDPLPSRGFEQGIDFKSYGEDLYFVCGMFKLKYKVATDEYSTNFCTHTHWVKPSFCVHKLDNYTKDVDQMIEFLKYCPEFLPFMGSYNF